MLRRSGSPDLLALRRLDAGNHCPCCSPVSGASLVIRRIPRACSDKSGVSPMPASPNGVHGRNAEHSSIVATSARSDLGTECRAWGCSRRRTSDGDDHLGLPELWSRSAEVISAALWEALCD